MRTNKGPSRQTTLQQNSERTKNTYYKTLKNEGIQNYLQEMTPTKDTDYTLWKATRKIKQPHYQIPPIRVHHNTWARTDKQKAMAFAQHLASVFQRSHPNYRQRKKKPS